MLVWPEKGSAEKETGTVKRIAVKRVTIERIVETSGRIKGPVERIVIIRMAARITAIKIATDIPPAP
ncbi:MAG: hypothetical protein WBK96_07835, partial [Candidatus Manganitrophaceae bacterium]